MELRKRFQQMMIDIDRGKIDILDIIHKPKSERSNQHKFAFSCYLHQNIPFFRAEDGTFDDVYLAELTSALKTVVFDQGEVIMRKGELGDRMFVSIQGDLGIYIQDYKRSKKPDVVVQRFNAVGEKALMEEGDCRSATVTALRNETICLCMHRDDYVKLIRYRKYALKEKSLGYFLQYPLLRKWPRTKVVVLNDSFVEQVFFKAGDIVYDMGQPAQTFYIIKSGELDVETVIQQQRSIKIPINDTAWEIKRQTKILQYRIRTLCAGDYFGHQEMLSRIEKRQTVVRAKTNCTLFYINADEVLSSFPQSTIEEMRQNGNDDIDLKLIKERMNEAKLLRQQRNDALLGAMNFNRMPKHMAEGGRLNIIKEGEKLRKISPWMDGVRKNKIFNQRLNDELKKTKLIKTINDSYIVERDSIITKDQERQMNESMKLQIEYAYGYKFEQKKKVTQPAKKKEDESKYLVNKLYKIFEGKINARGSIK